MTWTTIGGPAHSLAVFGGQLAALSPDQQAVFTRNPATGEWTRIGDAAEALIGGGWDLYATSPGGAGVFRYDGVNWHGIGGPGAQFTGVCNALYALTPQRDKVMRYDRQMQDWSVIGPTPAGNLIMGGSRVWASAPGDTAVWAWNRYDEVWTRIGGAGAQWVGVGSKLYGLTSDRQAVYAYDEADDRWRQIGGPAESLIDGGSFLYAVNPVSRDLWRYSKQGQWENIGDPGVGHVAADEMVWCLSPDRQEVRQYDDAAEETLRLRELMLRCYNHADYGRSVRRGFLVKRMSGEVLAEHGAETCFQPLSVLKLLPYLHALFAADSDPATNMSTRVSWYELDGATGTEKSDTVCLKAGQGISQASAPLSDVLPTMMWESHNRSLDAVLEYFGVRTITRHAQRTLGLSQTEMYEGCALADSNKRPWGDNITTLQDMARLYEGVDTMRFFEFGISRRLFETNMITIEDASPSYTSPITGRTSGPIGKERFRALVEEEARAFGKLSVVPNFMRWVTLRRKGGSGGFGSEGTGYADATELGLPFRYGSGSPVVEKYVIGWYLNQIIDPDRDVPPDADLLMFDVHDNWQVIDGPGSQWVCVNKIVYGLSPDKQAVFRRDQATGVWTQIGNAADMLIGGGNSLYAIHPSTKDIWRYTGAGLDWERIGDPGAAFAGVGSTVFGINLSGENLFRYDGTPGSWTKVHDNVSAVIGGGSTAYAIEASTSKVLAFSSSGNDWTNIGGAGNGFVADGNALFGMTTNRAEVWSYDGSPNQWTLIGGAADALAIAGGRLYALTPGKGAVYRWDGMPNSWSKVGDAVASLIGGGRELFAPSSPAKAKEVFADALFREPIREALRTW